VACGADADEQPATPSGLLSADQVGDVTGDPLIDPDLFVRYPRAHGSVTVGEWPSPPGAQRKLRTVRDNAMSARCQQGATDPGADTATVGRHTSVRAYQLVDDRVVTGEPGPAG